MITKLRRVDPSEHLAAGETTVATAERRVRQRRSPRVRVAGLQGYAIIAIAVVLVVAAIRAASAFLVPIAFSVVVALTLAPAVRLLQRLLPRWVASAVVVLTVVGGIGAASYSLSDEASRAVSGLPDATRALRQSLRTLTNRQGGPLAQLQRAVAELQKTATESTDRPSTPSGVTAVQVVAPPVDFTNFVWFGSQGVMALVGSVTLVTFLVYFLLSSGDLFKRKFVHLSGERLSRRKVTVQVIDQMGARVARSMVHLSMTSVLVGLCTWGLLAWFDVQYAALWGAAAALLNTIPYLGPAVVAAGLFLSGLVQFGDVATAAMIASVSLVVTIVEGSLLTPILFGKTEALNPVAVFVSFMFWGWVWGVPGMFLALPLLTIVKTVAESVEDLAPFAELLSD